MLRLKVTQTINVYLLLGDQPCYFFQINVRVLRVVEGGFISLQPHVQRRNARQNNPLNATLY